MSLSHAEAGAKGWRTEPCPARLELPWGSEGFTCQRPRQWQADTERAHLLHLWRGVIDGRKAEITWQDPP